MVKCGLLSASLSAFYQSRQLQIRILPPAKVWFFAIFVLLIIASMRSYTEGVTSAGRTALLANQNLNLILAILNTLSVRSWSHPSIDHMFILRDSCLALSFLSTPVCRDSKFFVTKLLHSLSIYTSQAPSCLALWISQFTHGALKSTIRRYSTQLNSTGDYGRRCLTPLCPHH